MSAVGPSQGAHYAPHGRPKWRRDRLPTHAAFGGCVASELNQAAIVGGLI
jgi:hypothetical protein